MNNFNEPQNTYFREFTICWKYFAQLCSKGSHLQTSLPLLSVLSSVGRRLLASPGRWAAKGVRWLDGSSSSISYARTHSEHQTANTFALDKSGPMSSVTGNRLWCLFNALLNRLESVQILGLPEGFLTVTRLLIHFVLVSMKVTMPLLCRPARSFYSSSTKATGALFQ